MNDFWVTTFCLSNPESFMARREGRPFPDNMVCPIMKMKRRVVVFVVNSHRPYRLETVSFVLYEKRTDCSRPCRAHPADCALVIGLKEST